MCGRSRSSRRKELDQTEIYKALGAEIYKALDVLVQRWKAVELAEKLLKDATTDEQSRNAWLQARHLELEPIEEDVATDQNELVRAAKAEKLRRDLAGKLAPKKE